MTSDRAFYAAARDAVVQYAREHAQLPPFKDIHTVRYSVSPYGRGANTTALLPPAIVRVLTCGGIEGDALQRAEDIWFTLLPFEDLGPTTPDEIRRDRVAKRVRFLRLLARLATAQPFRLHDGINCAVVNDDEPALSFWLELLRALAPDTEQDGEKELERNLATLSHGQTLRILVSVETNLRQDGLMSSLAHFFSCLAHDDEVDEAFANVVNVCGLSASTTPAEPVDVGLELLAGKVSPLMMTTILDGIVASKASSLLRVSSLRLGVDCPLAPKAAEAFGERLGALSLDTLQLNGTRNVRPLALRQTFRTASTSLRRFSTIDRYNSISAVASSLRSGASSIRELELELAGPANLDLAEWLAYSVFHVDSSAQISSLRLRIASRGGWLTPEWLVRFKNVLRNVTRPGADATSTITPDRHFVKLAANTVVKFATFQGKNTTQVDEEVEVLFEESGTVAINVPGVGIGRVPATAVWHRRTEPSRLRAFDDSVLPIKQHVTSLMWCGPAISNQFQTGGYVHMVDELLALIGEPLTRLSLPRIGLTNTQTSSVLRHCPNLKELNLGAQSNCDLTPIMDAHASGCNLDSLSMFRREAYQDAPIAPQLLQWLTGVRPVRLQRLAISALSPCLPLSERPPFHEVHLVPLLTQLKVANGLDYVDLRVSLADARNMSADLVEPTEEYRKMSKRRKFALLSVVHHAKHGGTIGQLDASVLGHIFKLCGEKRTLLVTNR